MADRVFDGLRHMPVVDGILNQEHLPGAAPVSTLLDPITYDMRIRPS
jgi:hypothetical protein